MPRKPISAMISALPLSTRLRNSWIDLSSLRSAPEAAVGGYLLSVSDFAHRLTAEVVSEGLSDASHAILMRCPVSTKTVVRNHLCAMPSGNCPMKCTRETFSSDSAEPSPDKPPRPAPIPGRQPDERQVPPEQPPPLTPTEPPIPPHIQDPKPDPTTDS